MNCGNDPRKPLTKKDLEAIEKFKKYLQGEMTEEEKEEYEKGK